jgi:predicted DNA-binding transcriptional regulator YafY
VSLPAGACLARQPYLDERWLTHELLRFGGEALPLSPPAAVSALGEVVRRLLERYA